MLVVMGNWNTKVHVGRPYMYQGEEGIAGKHALSSRKQNQQWRELDCELKLCSQSAMMFPHTDIHKINIPCTWTSPDRLHKNQYDHIVIK